MEVPSGEELGEWMKEQIDAKEEKSGTAATQKEVDRLKKALPVEAAKWPALNPNEVRSGRRLRAALRSAALRAS